MELLIDRDTFLPAIQAAVQVVDSGKASAPISEHVLIERKEDKLVLLVVGLDMELRQTIPGNFSVAKVKDLRTTASASRLASICQSLPPGAELRIVFSDPTETDKKGVPTSETNQGIHINSGLGRFRVLNLPPEDFPEVPKEKSTFEFCIDWADVQFLFSKTSVCMAAQDFRHYLNGMLLEIYPDRIRAVASDSHRLAVCERLIEAGLPNQNKEPLKVILPRRGVEKLQKFAPKHGAVTVAGSASYIAFSDEQRHFTCRLLEGQYPDYNSALPPPDEKNLLLIERSELQVALTQAGSVLLAEKEHRNIRLNLSKGRLHISANNRDDETSNIELPVDYQGEDMLVAFKEEYLKQLLDLIDSDRASLLFSSPETGCLIRPEEGEHLCRYLLMPLRL